MGSCESRHKATFLRRLTPPGTAHTNAEQLLFSSVVVRFGSRGSYSDLPQVPLIRPVRTGHFTHSV